MAIRPTHSQNPALCFYEVTTQFSRLVLAERTTGLTGPFFPCKPFVIHALLHYLARDRCVCQLRFQPASQWEAFSRILRGSRNSRTNVKSFGIICTISGNVHLWTSPRHILSFL